MLHPAAADGLERAFLHVGLHSVKQFRVILFQPFVLLGLRANESMLRIAIQEITLVRPRPSNLSLGLRPRPEPTGI